MMENIIIKYNMYNKHFFQKVKHIFKNILKHDEHYNIHFEIFKKLSLFSKYVQFNLKIEGSSTII